MQPRHRRLARRRTAANPIANLAARIVADELASGEMVVPVNSVVGDVDEGRRAGHGALTVDEMQTEPNPYPSGRPAIQHAMQSPDRQQVHLDYST